MVESQRREKDDRQSDENLRIEHRAEKDKERDQDVDDRFVLEGHVDSPHAIAAMGAVRRSRSR